MSVKALTEREWWVLCRRMEGMTGEGPLAGLPEAVIARSWRQLVHQRDCCLIWVFGDVGLRCAEARGVDVDMVAVGEASGHSIVVSDDIAKRGQGRTVPMTLLCRQAVARLVQSLVVWVGPGAAGPLFGAGREWRRLGVRRIEQIVRRFGREVLGRDVWPHMLRHTYACRLRRRVDLPVVQAMLGHRNLSSTQIYMGVDGDDLAAAATALSQ